MRKIQQKYNSCVEDLFLCPSVNSMSDFVQHGDVSCLEHCQSVSRYSYSICKILRLDYRSAARGGLLHDYFLYDWHHAPYKLHGFKHPNRALKNAQNDFDLNKIEIDIIKKHMWPLTVTPPRYLESLIVGMVDKGCTISEVIRNKRKK